MNGEFPDEDNLSTSIVHSLLFLSRFVISNSMKEVESNFLDILKNPLIVDVTESIVFKKFSIDASLSSCSYVKTLSTLLISILLNLICPKESTEVPSPLKV